MDEPEFTIKPDDYEPDLFNDMAVQEEITVGSTENVIGSSVEHDFVSPQSQTVSGSTVNLINSAQLPQQEARNRTRVIYLKSQTNQPGVNAARPFRVGGSNVKVIPLSKFNQDSNSKVIHLGQSMRSIPPMGGNVTRVINPNVIRNGPIQVTKLSNVNLSKISAGQKILINKPGNYRSMTPINFQSPLSFGQQNSIIQPLNPVQVSQQQHHTINSTPTAGGTLKLEPGDSGFYNLTGGNGPTRYYPRMHSPDKDSLDGSQEMSNVYKTNGLRKYARSVCDKVKEKGTTTYSEVADELVHEYAAEHPMIPAQQLHYIQKNIRRRVYDALNVLMALKVLEKEKKEIKWKGLPVNLLEECKQLEEEKSKKTDILQQKVEELAELVLQLISYKNLVGRNRQCAKDGRAVPLNERIKLPFLVITTNSNTVIDCNISSEKLEYMFTFDQPFEMQDEFQTLKQSGFTLGLGASQCTESQYKRCLELVPNTLRFYVEAIYQQRPAIVPDFLSLHRRNKTNQQGNRLVNSGLGKAQSAQYWSTASGSGSGVGLMEISQQQQSQQQSQSPSHDPLSQKRRSYFSVGAGAAGPVWSDSVIQQQQSHLEIQQQQSMPSKFRMGEPTSGPSQGPMYHHHNHHHQSHPHGSQLQHPHGFEDEDIEVMDEDPDFPCD